MEAQEFVSPTNEAEARHDLDALSELSEAPTENLSRCAGDGGGVTSCEVR